MERIWKVKFNLLIVLLATMASWSAWASGDDPSAPEIYRRFLTTQNRPVEFSIEATSSLSFGRQLAYELVEARRWLPDTRLQLLFARDLDNNGRVETWFLVRPGDVPKVIEDEAQDPDGWDVASIILAGEMRAHARPLWQLVVDGFQGAYLYGKDNFLYDHLVDAINLQSLQKQDEFLRRAGGEFSLDRQQIISQGWQALYKEFVNYMQKESQQATITAATLGYGIAGLARALVTQATEAAIARASAGQIVANEAKLVERIGWMLKPYAESLTSRQVMGSLAQPQAQAAIANFLSKESIKMSYSQLRRLLMEAALRARIEILTQAMAIQRDKKYLYASGTILTTINTWDYMSKMNNLRENSGSEDDYKITAANSLEGWAYMALDTVAFTVFRKRFNNLGTYLVVCSAISFINSAVTGVAKSTYIHNFVDSEKNKKFSDSVNIAQRATDLGYETSIGSVQVYVENATKETFAPKLMQSLLKNSTHVARAGAGVGWAVVVISQSAGYFGYNAFQNRWADKIQIALVPYTIPVKKLIDGTINIGKNLFDTKSNNQDQTVHVNVSQFQDENVPQLRALPSTKMLVK